MSGAARPGTQRIDAGALLAGIGAILLLVALFLDWFEPSLTAWTAFEALDLVLAGAALVSLAFAARSFGYAAVGEMAAIAAGGVALVVVASQLIDHPPPGIGRDLETGAWLGLVGAGLMLLGAFMSRTGIALAVDPARATARGPEAPATPRDSEQTTPLPEEPRP